MPVRARSASSIAAIAVLPPRLIVAQLVELGIDAVANDAAVARERRRLVDDRAVDRVADVGEVVDLRRPGS